MYNISCDYQFIQNLYSAPCYQWNYPIYYLPISPYSQNVDNKIFGHYQTQKPKLIISPLQNDEQESPKGDDEQFLLDRQQFSMNQSQKSIIKKKRKYYGTKNTQANIINQTFSFMNCGNKSRKVLQKLLKGDNKKMDVFYIMMKIVKRNLKKYVNRCYLRSIFEMDKNNMIYKLLSKGVKRLQILSIEKLVHYYFTNQMVTHLLSSNRLSKNTISEHLKRRRQIMSYIFDLRK